MKYMYLMRAYNVMDTYKIIKIKMSNPNKNRKKNTKSQKDKYKCY